MCRSGVPESAHLVMFGACVMARTGRRFRQVDGVTWRVPCDRLQQLTLDYHGGKPLADEDEIMARCQPLWNEPDRIRALADAGLQVLLGESRADARLGWPRLGTASAAPWCSNSPVAEPT